jgi:hypothetical protein
MIYSLLLSVFIAARMFTGSLPSNDDSSVVIEVAHMSQYQQCKSLGNRLLLTVWLFVTQCSHLSSFAAINDTAFSNYNFKNLWHVQCTRSIVPLFLLCTEINMPESYNSLSLLLSLSLSLQSCHLFLYVLLIITDISDK